MAPNPTQAAMPETKGEGKVEFKPTMYTDSENKQLEQTMTTSLKCSARKCTWKTDELTQAMATEHLKLHREANHGIHGASQDKLQKLDRPVLMTGCSQQDFGLFKEEWGR